MRPVLETAQTRVDRAGTGVDQLVIRRLHDGVILDLFRQMVRQRQHHATVDFFEVHLDRI